MLRFFYTLFFVVGLSLFAQAQDPTFSQFYASRSYMNPAFTGVEKGLCLVSAYRNHYFGVPTQGAFRTMYAAFEVQEPLIRSGLGIVMYQDEAGDARLMTQSVRANYAYHIPLSDASRGGFASEIMVGMSAGWLQRSINWSKLTFLDQIDAVQGFTQPSAAVPIVRPVSFFDASAGAVWRGVFQMPHSNEDMYANVGIAAAHITPQDESLLGKPTARPLRLTLHGGVELPVRWFDGQYLAAVRWSPNVKMEWQQGQLLGTIGAFAQFGGGYLGIFHQNKYFVPENLNTNALMFNAGMKFPFENSGNNMLIGISYDANTTGLGTAAAGSFEMTMRFNWSHVQFFRNANGKMQKGREMKCPRNF
jgi:type IX secretion system PorP/SprF family membrane protein